jgi:hypothetical protein
VALAAGGRGAGGAGGKRHQDGAAIDQHVSLIVGACGLLRS